MPAVTIAVAAAVKAPSAVDPPLPATAIPRRINSQSSPTHTLDTAILAARCITAIPPRRRREVYDQATNAESQRLPSSAP